MAVNIYGSTEISKPVERVVAQKDREVYGLKYPFGSVKETGGFFSKESGVSLIKGAIKQLLNTQKGERVMHPAFGVDLRRYLFQPLDEDTFEDIKSEILYSFNRYIVGAKITKLIVEPADTVSVDGGNGLRIILTVRLNPDYLKVFDVEVVIS